MSKNAYEIADAFLSDLNSKLTLEESRLDEPITDFLGRYSIHPRTWERVQRHLSRERLLAEKDAVRQDLARIRKTIKERDIDELISSQFGAARKEEANWIKARLIDEVDAWDHHYDESYTLAKMLEEGLPGIRKQMRGKRFRWRYISWGWNVLVNLFVLIVVLSIYSHIATAFETIVVSLLILLYVTVLGGHSASGQTWFAQLQFHAEIYRNLRKAIGKELTFAENAELDALGKEQKKHQVKFWINACSNSILYYIVVWQLLKAVF